LCHVRAPAFRTYVIYPTDYYPKDVSLAFAASRVWKPGRGDDGRPRPAQSLHPMSRSARTCRGALSAFQALQGSFCLFVMRLDLLGRRRRTQSEKFAGRDANVALATGELSLSPDPGTKREFRCLVCVQLFEVFDGTKEVASGHRPARQDP